MKKKSNFIIITMLIILIALIIVFAYAAYKTLLNGNGLFITAKPIIQIQIEDANEISNINSYYNIVIKNYNENNESSEIAFDYTVDVKSTDGSELPQYCWYDEQGNSLGSELKGTFSDLTKQEQKYKICFLNTGNEDISKNIKFKTRAVQKK